MINLHTHTILSDGGLLPSEMVRHCVVKGYRAVAITDHVDGSNIDFVVLRTVKICEELSNRWNIVVVPGVELTQVPLKEYDEMIRYVRSEGIRLVLVHGETLVEPVIPGTNRKALESDVDILTHPGLISKEEVSLAAQKGIYLEITTRKGHSLSNGHVVKLAREAGASLVLNTDAHLPEDLISDDEAERFALGAGLTEGEVKTLFQNAEEILKKVQKKKSKRLKVRESI